MSLSAWMLAGVLTLLISADVAFCGTASRSASACVGPVIAAGVPSAWAGPGMAVIGAGMAWLLAWCEITGRSLWPGRDMSQLAANAPGLTFFFLLVALMAGVWAAFVHRFRQRGWDCSPMLIAMLIGSRYPL